MLETTPQAQAEFARIQALYDAEIARNAVPTTADELPISFEQIPDAWYTATLCREVVGASVVGHTLGPVDDGTTNRRSLRVAYNAAGEAAGLPEKLFMKASFGLSNRFTLGPCGAVAAEADFYSHVRPHLSIEAPEGVFAKWSESFNSMIILKDISGRVAEFCDQTTAITRERAEDQVRTLATLHARGATDPAILAARSRFTNWFDFFHSTKMFGLDLGAKAGFDAASALIPERTHRRASEVWDATEAAVAHAATLPATFCHGDVHLKNWYITTDGAMGLSDWQCAHNGHWGRDLAYAIGTALTIEHRRAWEYDLIALYLEELGRGGGPIAPLEQAWDIYRRQMLPALAWWTVTLNPAPGMPEMQPHATAVEFVQRLGTAIDDLESLDVD